MRQNGKLFGCPQKKRFLSLNDEERNILLDSAIPKNTKNATNNWISTLNGYLKTKQIANNVDEILDSDLPQILEKFYSEVTKDNKKKKVDGKENEQPERYCNTSM